MFCFSFSYVIILFMVQLVHYFAATITTSPTCITEYYTNIFIRGSDNVKSD